MRRTPVSIENVAAAAVKALPAGILLTTKAGEKTDTMVIGWGAVGIEWGKPVFTCYVRHSRFTHDQLEKAPEFTVNIPVGGADPKILKVCGSQSGRDVDKVKALGLTLVDGTKVAAPAVREFPLTLECRVVYRKDQEAADLDPSLLPWYPENEEGRRDIHTAYYAEILAAYLIEE